MTMTEPQPKRKPREWWLSLDAWGACRATGEQPPMFNYGDGWEVVLVREVLEDDDDKA
jgi:hypothetical protein